MDTTVTKTKSGHILSVIKAGVSAVPYVGGPIASLIGDYVPTATQRSLDRAIEILQRRLTELEDRIDVEAVNKDEFSELFKSSYLVIVRTHHEERLRAAVELIVNPLLRNEDPDKLSYTELDHFVRCLDRLSLGAIEVLAHIQQSVKEPGKFSFEYMKSRLPNDSPDLLFGLLSELNVANLVHLPSVPTVKTSDYGNYVFELTSLGRNFVKRVLRFVGPPS